MKKTLGIIFALSLILTACGTATTNTTTPAPAAEEKTFKVGIVQLIEHPALDASREGFIKALEDNGVNVEIDYVSAQGDIAVARTISEKFVADGVDLIFAIATPAAEAAVGTGTEIPILFSAVTDPVAAHLVESNESPGGTVTGTSDIVDIKGQLEIFKQIDENIGTIGIVYSADEANSLAQLEIVEAAAPELGLTVESIAIQSISDLPQAAQSIATKVDGVYMVSDNKIASSVTLLADVLKENKIPSVCAEEALVIGGGLIANGISYFEIGEQTGTMAKKILVDGISPSDIPVEQAKNISKLVNPETLESLGLDANLDVFKDAAMAEITE